MKQTTLWGLLIYQASVLLVQIVYVAPMKALAAEMTNYFSKRLEPLGITVKELTGDMQLSKGEILRTQVRLNILKYCSVCIHTSSSIHWSFLHLLKVLVKQLKCYYWVCNYTGYVPKCDFQFKVIKTLIHLKYLKQWAP